MSSLPTEQQRLQVEFMNRQIAGMLRTVADKLERGELVKVGGELSITIDPVHASPQHFGMTSNLVFEMVKVNQLVIEADMKTTSGSTP